MQDYFVCGFVVYSYTMYLFQVKGKKAIMSYLSYIICEERATGDSFILYDYYKEVFLCSKSEVEK